jgi:mannonate dehydratase
MVNSMRKFIQSMRWYGPNDAVRLSDIRQAGCTEVVTALHHIPYGEIWTIEEIEKRCREVGSAGMKWTVIESLPVHEDIKKWSGNYLEYIENYKISLRNVAECGLKVVTYNFMPILDWLRTDPFFELPTGARTLKFERLSYVAFELFLLQRPGAEKDFTAKEIQDAKMHFEQMSQETKDQLFRNMMLGLPGSDIPFTRDEILAALKGYEDIDDAQLKEHLFSFLKEVVPVAEEVGLKMAIHPDDPPYPVLGLPRIVSTEKDASDLLDAVDSIANGLCFCTGSYGARPDNDLIGMMKKFGDRIHFFHLRNTKRFPNGDFMEADHLSGDTDMVAVVKEAIAIMERRGESIPMRPDHGHQMLDDLDKTTYPGYSAIGRLRGLAEVRGVEAALVK